MPGNNALLYRLRDRSDGTRATTAVEQAWSVPGELIALGRRQTNRRYLWLLAVLVDVAAISLAYSAGGTIRLDDPFHPQVFNILAVVLPIYLAVALNNHGFDFDTIVRPRTGIPLSLTAFMVSLSFVLLVIFMLKVAEDFSRIVFITGGAFALLIKLPIGRILVGWFAARVVGATATNEVVIAEGPLRPATSDAVGPEAVVLDVVRLGVAPSLDDPTFFDRLGRCLKWADRVVVACPPERRAFWADALRGANVSAEVFADELDELGAIGISTFGARRTFLVTIGPLGTADRLTKRVLDLALVVVAMPVVLPLMAMVAVAIRLDSNGPIFFTQERVGLGNRLFRMYKFRSMYVFGMDPAGRRSTGRDDDRITRVGRFIRATSLDELPQVFNVLTGAMSIVGPRPHALGSRAEDHLFWTIDPAYWHRHAVKPGMTGLAQVRGHRGATEKASDLRHRLHADLEYLSGWTVWRDIRIILATARVLVHRNAF